MKPTAFLSLAHLIFVASLVSPLGVAHGGSSPSEDLEQYCRDSTRTRAFEGEKVYVVGEQPGIETPRLLPESPQPLYPAAAERGRIQGIVVVEVVIDTKGDVVTTNVCRQLPMGMTENAVSAIEQWKFSISRLDGQPVYVSHVVGADFKLKPRQTLPARELEVSFQSPRWVGQPDVIEAGRALSELIGPEMSTGIQVSSIYLTPDVISVGGVSVSENALDRFVAQLTGLAVFGFPTIPWRKTEEDGSVRFRVFLDRPTTQQY